VLDLGHAVAERRLDVVPSAVEILLQRLQAALELGPQILEAVLQVVVGVQDPVLQRVQFGGPVELKKFGSEPPGRAAANRRPGRRIQKSRSSACRLSRSDRL